MKLYIITVALLLGLAGVADAQDHPGATAVSFKDERSKVSYAFGMNIGRGWKVGQVDLDTDWVSQGLKAALAGRATLITEVEMSEALTKFGQALEAHQQHRDAPERGRNPQPGYCSRATQMAHSKPSAT